MAVIKILQFSVIGEVSDFQVASTSNFGLDNYDEMDRFDIETHVMRVESLLLCLLVPFSEAVRTDSILACIEKYLLRRTEFLSGANHFKILNNYSQE